MAEGARLLAEYMAASPEAVREAYETEKRNILALSEQAVCHAIRTLENTDWSVSEQLESLWNIMDGLHAAKRLLHVPCQQDSIWNDRSSSHSCRAGACEMVHAYSGQTDSSEFYSKAAYGSRDPHQVDAAAWARMRANPDTKRLCDLYVRLQLLIGLKTAAVA